jgi:hypothetical protein
MPAPTPETAKPQPVTIPDADTKRTTESPANPFEPKDEPSQERTPPKASTATQPKPASDAKSNRKDIQAIASALKAARAALESGDFAGVRAKLAEVESLPKLPEHQGKVERLDLLAQYAQQFRTALKESINNLEAGSEIKVGTDEVIAFVSATLERITIRTRGVSRTYAINDLPPGLAVPIADTWLDQNDPVSLVSKAAYVASLKDASDDQLAKAREWFQEAAKRGVDIGDLAKVIDDTYELQKDLVP